MREGMREQEAMLLLPFQTLNILYNNNMFLNRFGYAVSAMSAIKVYITYLHNN